MHDLCAVTNYKIIVFRLTLAQYQGPCLKEEIRVWIGGLAHPHDDGTNDNSVTVQLLS